jgi:hypothetical protein
MIFIQVSYFRAIMALLFLYAECKLFSSKYMQYGKIMFICIFCLRAQTLNESDEDIMTVKYEMSKIQ